jgi:site-specific DNA-methyltransferase (adenine-specific)
VFTSFSGTTAIACIKERRHFIGFEKDETYWRMSIERIKNEKAQLKLF